MLSATLVTGFLRASRWQLCMYIALAGSVKGQRSCTDSTSALA